MYILLKHLQRFSVVKHWCNSKPSVSPPLHFLAAQSSSGSLVVGPLVGPSVRPTPLYLCDSSDSSNQKTFFTKKRRQFLPHKFTFFTTKLVSQQILISQKNQKLKLWQNWKTQIVTKLKLKNLNLTLKKLKLWKKNIFWQLKNSNFDKTQELKCDISKLNCD